MGRRQAVELETVSAKRVHLEKVAGSGDKCYVLEGRGLKMFIV